MSFSTDRDETIELTSDALRVGVSTQRGARVTSLLSRLDDREWLRKAPGTLDNETLAYGSVFTDSDHGGWDEMFPTVDPCVFPGEPFAGEPVPDHGELWQLEWEVVEKSASAVHQRVSSDRFSYTFDRRLSVSGATLRAQYDCRNESDTGVPLLWALHPQFAMREGSRVVLAGKLDNVLDTSDASSVREVQWSGDLQVDRDVPRGTDRMIYVNPRDEISGASIVDQSGSSLTLTWDREFAPYFGIWLDHGRHTEESVVALEPTNGFFDDLNRAQGSDCIRSFEPGATTSWWIEIAVGRS
jgi:galactose mutarotase-like enzyme